MDISKKLSFYKTLKSVREINKSFQSMSISPPFCWGGQPLVPNFEKMGGLEKKSAKGVFKSPCHRCLPGGAYVLFLVKKDFVKLLITLRAQFSNANLNHLCTIILLNQMLIT